MKTGTSKTVKPSSVAEWVAEETTTGILVVMVQTRIEGTSTAQVTMPTPQKRADGGRDKGTSEKKGEGKDRKGGKRRQKGRR